MFINRKQIIERLMCSPLTLHLPKNYRDGIKDLLEKAPAVDAVEVVRCKDCRLATESMMIDGWFECANNDMTHHPNHYCSYGERKDMA